MRSDRRQAISSASDSSSSPSPSGRPIPSSSPSLLSESELQQRLAWRCMGGTPVRTVSTLVPCAKMRFRELSVPERHGCVAVALGVLVRDECAGPCVACAAKWLGLARCPCAYVMNICMRGPAWALFPCAPGSTRQPVHRMHKKLNNRIQKTRKHQHPKPRRIRTALHARVPRAMRMEVGQAVRWLSLYF